MDEAAVKTKGWTKDSVAKFGNTIGAPADKPGFFKACVTEFSKKGVTDPEGLCASMKDTYYGDTMWRGKEKGK